VELAHASVAVTGATGFLGEYLVAALRARGARAVAVVRNREKAARVLPSDVELRVADLADTPALTRAFHGVDAVIANAAVISFRDPALTMRTNVEGTRNVFTALAHAGVRRAVLMSSSAAYPLSLAKSDEDTPLRALRRLRFLSGFANAYGVSKAEAERVAWRAAELHQIALTTFRPCGITGPNDPLLMATIERFLRPRVTLFPAFTEVGVVHAGDVAGAVMLALAQPKIASGRAYNLQGHTATLWQIADAWARAGGQAARLRVPIPVPIAMRHDDTRVRRELGWLPRSLEAIVEEAVRVRSLPLE
jgi:nucleoside-diphosphate-sugar epimerase